MQLKKQGSQTQLKAIRIQLKVVEMQLESNQKADDVLEQLKHSQNAVKMQLRVRAAKIQQKAAEKRLKSSWDAVKTKIQLENS